MLFKAKMPILSALLTYRYRRSDLLKSLPFFPESPGFLKLRAKISKFETSQSRQVWFWLIKYCTYMIQIMNINISSNENVEKQFS